MSSPYPPRENPDRRPLPPGWIAQYDENYRAWFYVNERANPPETTWVHPLGPPGSPRPHHYGPPSGPPPPPGGPYGYENREGYPGYRPDYQSPPPQQPYYGNSPPPPPQGYYRPEEDRGFFNRPSSNPPPQQVAYGQAAPPPKKHGMGTGAMLGVGAAGLIGGAVLGEMFEHHEERERFDAYEAGRESDFGGRDGFDGPGFDGGYDDFGGGGW